MYLWQDIKGGRNRISTADMVVQLCANLIYFMTIDRFFNHLFPKVTYLIYSPSGCWDFAFCLLSVDMSLCTTISTVLIRFLPSFMNYQRYINHLYHYNRLPDVLANHPITSLNILHRCYLRNKESNIQ